MKLTKKVIKAIDNQKSKLQLALALGFSEQWIIRLVDQNKENGPLTTIRALQELREMTGLSDSEILAETKPATERLK